MSWVYYELSRPGEGAERRCHAVLAQVSKQAEADAVARDGAQPLLDRFELLAGRPEISPSSR